MRAPLRAAHCLVAFRGRPSITDVNSFRKRLWRSNESTHFAEYLEGVNGIAIEHIRWRLQSNKHVSETAGGWFFSIGQRVLIGLCPRFYKVETSAPGLSGYYWYTFHVRFFLWFHDLRFDLQKRFRYLEVSWNLVKHNKPRGFEKYFSFSARFLGRTDLLVCGGGGSPTLCLMLRMVWKPRWAEHWWEMADATRDLHLKKRRWEKCCIEMPDFMHFIEI